MTRSWDLTRTLWWRLIGLVLAVGIVGLPVQITPAPFHVVLESAMQVVLQTTLVLAYLRVTGRQPVDPLRDAPAVPAPAV